MFDRADTQAVAIADGCAQAAVDDVVDMGQHRLRILVQPPKPNASVGFTRLQCHGNIAARVQSRARTANGVAERLLPQRTNVAEILLRPPTLISLRQPGAHVRFRA